MGLREWKGPLIVHGKEYDPDDEPIFFASATHHWRVWESAAAQSTIISIAPQPPNVTTAMGG